MKKSKQKELWEIIWIWQWTFFPHVRYFSSNFQIFFILSFNSLNELWIIFFLNEFCTIEINFIFANSKDIGISNLNVLWSILNIIHVVSFDSTVFLVITTVNHHIIIFEIFGWVCSHPWKRGKIEIKTNVLHHKYSHISK